MAGRKTHPTVLKLLKGETRPSRHNANEPLPPETEGVPVAPEYFSVAERVHWERMAPILDGMRVLSEADLPALEAMCIEWAKYLEARDYLVKHGSFIAAPSGYVQAHPYVAILNKSFLNWQRMSIEFGLTPSSRAKINVLPEKKKDNPYAKFGGK